MTEYTRAITESDIDNRIEEWHNIDVELWAAMGAPELHEYLGWTWEEYKEWMQRAD
jgi:hypothetical protein